MVKDIIANLLCFMQPLLSWPISSSWSQSSLITSALTLLLICPLKLLIMWGGWSYAAIRDPNCDHRTRVTNHTLVFTFTCLLVHVIIFASIWCMYEGRVLQSESQMGSETTLGSNWVQVLCQGKIKVVNHQSPAEYILSILSSFTHLNCNNKWSHKSRRQHNKSHERVQITNQKHWQVYLQQSSWLDKQR